MEAGYAAFVDVHASEGVSKADVVKHLLEMHQTPVVPEPGTPAPRRPTAPPGPAQLADLQGWNQVK